MMALQSTASPESSRKRVRNVASNPKADEQRLLIARFHAKGGGSARHGCVQERRDAKKGRRAVRSRISRPGASCQDSRRPRRRARERRWCACQRIAAGDGLITRLANKPTGMSPDTPSPPTTRHPAARHLPCETWQRKLRRPPPSPSGTPKP
jgi:hypothetical protein